MAAMKKFRNGQVLGTSLLSIEAGFAEWSAMMEFRTFIRPRRVAMRVDMNHRDRCFAADGFEDRTCDRVIATA